MLLGKIALACGEFGLIFYLSRSGLLVDLGAYALLNAFLVPLNQFTGFQLGNLVVKGVENATISEFFWCRLILAMFAIGAAAFMLLSGLLGPSATWELLLLVAMRRAVDGLAEVTHGFWRKNGQFRAVGCAQALRGIGGWIAFISCMITTQCFAVGIAARCIASTSLLLFIEIPFTIKLDRTASVLPRTRALKSIATAGLPLGLAVCLVQVADSIPRVFLASEVSTMAVGAFVTLMQPMVAGRLIVAAMTSYALPGLCRSHKLKNRREFWNLAVKLIASTSFLGLVTTLLAVILGENIVKLLGVELFASRNELIVLAVYASGQFIVSALGFALTAKGILTHQVSVFIASLLLVYLSSLWLIPKYGLCGACYSVLCGTAMQAIGFGVLLKYGRGDD